MYSSSKWKAWCHDAQWVPLGVNWTERQHQSQNYHTTGKSILENNNTLLKIISTLSCSTLAVGIIKGNKFMRVWSFEAQSNLNHPSKDKVFVSKFPSCCWTIRLIYFSDSRPKDLANPFVWRSVGGKRKRLLTLFTNKRFDARFIEVKNVFAITRF